MLEGFDGLTITLTGGGLIAVGAVAVKVIDAVMKHKGSNNGFVKREDCHKSMDKLEGGIQSIATKMDTKFGELHEKVNDTNEKVAEMKGFVEAHLN